MNIEDEIVGQVAEEAPLEQSINQSMPFPVDCLPAVLENMATGIAEIAGVPVEMSAPIVLAVASAATGRAVLAETLQNKQTGSNLYLLFSKQSGSGGSTAFRIAIAPLMGREAQLRRDFEDFEKPRIETDRDMAQSEIDRCKSDLRKGNVEDKSAIIESLKTARKKLADAEKAIISPLLAMSDSTPEGAAKILSEQGECLFHADADAGDAIKSAMGGYQEGNGPSEALWLKAFNGEPVTITRRNAPTMKLERPTLALCWVMTPDSMRSLFSKDRLSEGGFLARCLVANVPGKARYISEDDAGTVRKIASEVSQSYEAAIWEAINTYRLGELNDSPAIIGMTSAARLEFIREWNKILEKTNEMPSAFEARHIELAMRIAMVIHLFHHIKFEKRGDNTWGVQEGGMTGHTVLISVDVARAAMKIMYWFIAQQAALLAPQKESAEAALFEKVQNKIRSTPNGITRRDITGHIFPNADEAEKALTRWVESGVLIKIEPPKRTGPGRAEPPRYKIAPFSR